MTWGLLPHDTTDPARAPQPVHASAETVTVTVTPMFADAFRRRWTIVPMDTYQQRRTTGGAAIHYTVMRARRGSNSARRPPA
jgi:putative SOS response-associated peptidase YedK